MVLLRLSLSPPISFLHPCLALCPCVFTRSPDARRSAARGISSPVEARNLFQVLWIALSVPIE
eukprot:1081515-Pyramimonas_sp.AAC.1